MVTYILTQIKNKPLLEANIIYYIKNTEKSSGFIFG